jgi:hypothetical protein
LTTPSNTFLTYDQIGRREDLSNFVYLISPTRTPFRNSIARTIATGRLHEWQIDSLAAAAQNRVLEGDDATTDAVTATTRLSNTVQISDKVARVSGTAQAVQVAGRRNELAYQVVKKSKELNRDMENDLLANATEAAGDTSTARGSAGVPAWITANTSNGSGGSDGSLGNTARTDGTQRSFTETLLKAVLKLCYDSGGDPECIMVGSFNKQKLSGFTGNATREVQAADNKLYAAISVYQSDFGELEVITNRFMRARDCLVLEKRMWAVAYLRPIRMTRLAKTGDSERRQIITEWTLESRNEAASGAVWDLTTS